MPSSSSTQPSAADFMMGVYLLLIATHDVVYRDQYNRHALDWMNSWGCRATGILAMLSSEVSVFILACMSVECCVAVSFPYRPPCMTRARGLGVLAALWTAGAVVALAPIFSTDPAADADAAAVFGRFYGSNGVCFPLYIHDPYAAGWKYSAFVFVGVNLAAAAVIAVCYAGMCCSVRRTRADCGRRESVAAAPSPLDPVGIVQDRSMAKRFLLIVVADLICWLPVIVIKMLAFADFRISGQFPRVRLFYPIRLRRRFDTKM